MDISKNSPFNKTTNTFYGQNNGFELMTLEKYSITSANPKYRFTTYEQTKINLNLNYLPDLYASIGNTITENCSEEKEFSDLKLFGVEYPIPSSPMSDYSQVQALSIPAGTKNPTIVKISARYQSSSAFETLGNLIEKNFSRIYVIDSAVNDSAIHELSNVLSNNRNRSDLKDSSNLVDMYLLYSMLNDAFKYKAMEVNSADSSQSTFAKITPIYQEIDSMFHYIWKESGSTNSVWNKFRSELITDWAQLNRLSNHKEKAISLLDTGIYYSEDSVYKQGYRDLKCINQFEILLQNDSNLMLDSAITICPCIKTVYNDKDSSYYTNKDSSVHYCNWESTALKKQSAFKFTENSTSLVYVEDLTNPNHLIDIDSNGIYTFKEGRFKFHYFDSLSVNISTLTLNVIADSIFSIDSSFEVHYCDMSNYGIDSRWKLNQPSLPFIIVNDSNHQKSQDLYLKKGSYTINVFDTLNCAIKTIKGLVIADTVTNLISKDTSLFEYGSNPSNIDSFYLHLGKYAYYVAQNNISLISNQFSNCHFSGIYNFVVPDSSSCTTLFYNVTLYSDSISIINTSKSVNYCLFNDSTYKSGYFYFPSHKLNYDIFKIDNDTTLIMDHNLSEGLFQVNYYDTTFCKIYRESIEVTKDVATTNVLDSVIGYCGMRFTGIFGCAPYRPIDSVNYRIKMVYPDTMNIFDSCLIAGRYIVSYYDEYNCTLKKYNLSVDDSFYCEMPFMENNINTHEHYKKYLAYPNPSTGQLRIVVSEEESIKEIRLIDFSGKLIRQYNSQDINNEMTIEASALSQGIYFVQTITNIYVYQSKVQFLK